VTTGRTVTTDRTVITERALTRWSDSGVVENQPKIKQSDFELEFSASKRGS
jgi:hypothetical protein